MRDVIPVRPVARTFALLAMLVVAPCIADGQTNISSSGLGTRIIRNGATYEIEGGTRAGANLFHSFGSFSVGARDTARFHNTNGSSVANIVGRVSGGTTSTIAGTIDTLTYPGADLWLINPAGVVFGRGARLSVDGSVHVSTAGSVRFSSGSPFHAVPDAIRDRSLSVANPVAFGFLERDPAPITVRSADFGVPVGRTLSLVGGDVSIADTTLSAGGGRLQIASVSGAGDVIVAPSLDIGTATPRGTITLRNARLDVSGPPSGSIVIRGGELFATASAMSANSFAPVSAPVGVDIDVTGTVRLSSRTTVDSAVFGAGRSGDIRIVANDIVIDGSTISTTAFIAGVGGTVELTAGEAVTISGPGASVATSTNAIVPTGVGGRVVIRAPAVRIADSAELVSRTSVAAPGGDIVIEATTLDVTDRALILTRTGGAQGGDILLDVDGTLRISDAGILAGGSVGGAAIVGDITLNVGTLLLTNGAGIQSGDVGGRTGNISVTARDAIVIDDRSNITSQAFAQQIGAIRLSADRVLIDGGFVLASTSGESRAGDVAISADTVTLSGGGQVVTSSEVGATGAGGNIAIVARQSLAVGGSSPDGVPVTPRGVTTPDSGLYSTAGGIGAGGRIDIRGGAVILSDRGRVSVETTGTGSAGSIDLASQSLAMASGARLDSSTSGAGTGGTITVRVGGPLTLAGGAGLFSDTRRSGAGGNIAVTANEIELADGATVSATSTGTADALAGNLELVFGERFRMLNASITTESLSAPGGNIAISSTGSLLYLVDSQITTSVRAGAGGGGNITIGTAGHPLEFLVLRNAGIHADAHGGPGGNIDIFARAFFTNVPIETAVTASSALSTPGTINISAPITDVSGSLAELPAGLLEAAALLRASCAARLAEGKASSLVVAGREGVPREPGGLLASNVDDTGVARPRSSDVPPFAPVSLPLRLSYFDGKCGAVR